MTSHSWATVFGIFVASLRFAVGEHLALANEDAARRDLRRIEFRIEVSTRVVEQQDASDEFAPGKGCFVFAPPLGSKLALPGQDWLRERPPLLQPRVLEFEIQDREVLPAASIVLVGDTVNLMTVDGASLAGVAPPQAPIRGHPAIKPGVRLNEPTHTSLWEFSPGRKSGVRSAYAAVSDHGFGRVANDTGVAVFEDWPTTTDMAVEVRYPWAIKAIDIESDTLEVLGRRFVVVRAGVDAATHTIRFVPRDN